MSGYSDDYREQQQREWQEKWAAKDTLPEFSEENFGYWVARAREAEYKISKYHEELDAAKKLFGL